MIGHHDQYSKLRLSTLSIASLLSLLFLVSPGSLFSQDSSSPSPDFNDDGIVNLLDYALFRSQWDTREGGPNWDAKFDLHGDGVIDLWDYDIFVSNWGKTFPVNNRESSPQQEVTSQVTISAGTHPVTEGTSATFTITANPAPTSPLNVNVDVSEDGDVISGTASSIVIINANNTTATLTVNTDNDEADESNSVITAEVERGTGYTVGSSSSASVTVEDNDYPEVTISAGTTPVTEGTAVTFTITASSAPTSPLIVNVNVSETRDVISGTPSSTVTIKANEATATLTVNTDNDDADESNSVVTAAVESGTGYTVGSSSSASVTVNDNDNPAPPPVSQQPRDAPEVTISAGTTPVTEGTAATFTITASTAPSSALTVNVNVSEDGDVISDTVPSTVTINANATTATLTVDTVNDQADEGASKITAEVESGTGYTVGSSSSASVTVNDNDDPEITISAGTSPVTEGTSATFTITASSAPTSPLIVNVDVSEDGDVISGTPSSTVIINANNTTATLTVNTVNDQVDESNSVITAEVESGIGYTVGSSSSASVTVNDNDDPTPALTISAGTTSVTEGTDVTFTITASPAPTSDLTVNVDVSETGNVISGTPSSTVTIKADETTAKLTINTVNDQTDESNSVITAKVETGTGYTKGTPSSAGVTVRDNDPPQVTISAGTTPVTEGTSATFTITASLAPTSPLIVNVDVSEDGDVISGTPSSTVTIKANETTAKLTVATDNDESDESNSVVTAEVESGTGYTVGSSSSASVTVNDNDDASPQVTISAGTTPVTEGTDVTFTITAFPAPTSDLTVNVTVNLTYADHMTSDTPPSTVTIKANETTATLTIATDDDDVIEFNGQIIAEVESGTGYTVGSSSSARVIVENDDRPTPVASVEIDPSSIAFAKADSSVTLTVRILDSEGNETRATSWGWSSANKEVATVNSLIGRGIRGSVRSVGEGTTTITLSVGGEDDSEAEGTVSVTVTIAGPKVQISPGSLTFESLGETQTVTVKVLDENGDEDEDATWGWIGFFSPCCGIDDPGSNDIEKVDGTLEVTSGVTGSGKVTIRSDGAKSAVLLLTVYQNPASLTLSPNSADLTVGGKVTLSAAIQDANGYDAGRVDIGDAQGGLVVYWETSDATVATVDGVTKNEERNTGGTATVTAMAAGIATITGRHPQGDIIGTATITVTE